MATTTIATGEDVATLINVFIVTRQTQQQLVDLLVEATEPGYAASTRLRLRQHPRQPGRHPGRQLRPVAQPRGLPGNAR